MRAYVLKHYGGPEGSQLMDVPAPAPRPRDILVEVHAAGLNPVDFKFRQGKLRAILRPRLPLVLGNELAGQVIAVGRDVKRFRAGDRVFARVAKDRAGAFAEQACVNEDDAAHMPRNLDFTAAAAVPLAGLTALQALRDELDVKPGQKLFISGGAGGVGTSAIQIAKWLGAHVTTTASPRGEALVRSLGADEVIDYQAQKFEDVARKIDIVLDSIGGDTQERSWKVLKKGGVLVSIVQPPSGEKARSVGARGAMVQSRPDGAKLAEIAKIIDSGQLAPLINRILPLSEARRAQELSQSGHMHGKIVLRVVNHNGGK